MRPVSLFKHLQASKATVKEVSNEVTPPLLMVKVAMDSFQSTTGDLLCSGDASKEGGVALRVAAAFEEEVELLDGGLGLVAFAFVIPEIKEAVADVLIFGADNSRKA